MARNNGNSSCWVFLWHKKKGHRIPLSASTLPCLLQHTLQVWKKEGKTEAPPAAKSAHRENLLGSAESSTSEPAVLYAVDWKKRGIKGSFKEFLLPAFPTLRCTQFRYSQELGQNVWCGYIILHQTAGIILCCYFNLRQKLCLFFFSYLIC